MRNGNIVVFLDMSRGISQRCAVLSAIQTASDWRRSLTMTLVSGLPRDVIAIGVKAYGGQLGRFVNKTISDALTICYDDSFNDIIT